MSFEDFFLFLCLQKEAFSEHKQVLHLQFFWYNYFHDLRAYNQRYIKDPGNEPREELKNLSIECPLKDYWEPKNFHPS